MANAYVELVNLDEVVKKIGDIADLKTALAKPLSDSLKLLHKDLTTYPMPPKPTYRRTFRLQRSWRMIIDTNGLGGKVRSSGVPYNKWVQNLPTQAWMHVGFWNNTIQQTGQGKQAQVVKIFDAHLDKLVR